MSTGLPTSRLINASIFLSPSGAKYNNVNSFIIIGDTDSIDVGLRFVPFADMEEVATMFGVNDPEYKSAENAFEQKPQPTLIYIGRWASGATHGLLFGETLTANQQALSNFTAVTSGGFKIQIDGAGSATNVAGINLSSATTLNGVATLINTALSGAAVAATVSWSGSQFIFKSTATGAASKVLPLVAPTSGTNLAILLKGTVAFNYREVDGIIAELPVDAVTIIDNLPGYQYGITFATTINITDSQYIAVANYVEAAGNDHLFAITTQAASAIDPVETANLGQLLSALGVTKTFGQYSSTDKYAISSALARIITVDFNANNSTITLMYKTEPGVIADTLTTSQANALDAKRWNYFANYDNGTAIFQNGVCFGDAYVDETFGLAWLKNRVQTDLFNALFTTATKVPQTDAGNNILVGVITKALDAAVNNGFVAAGTWTSGGFGQLAQGEFMPTGYYIYAPPVSTQSTVDRAARKSVSFQVAVKLAGAIHDVILSISVNR